MTYLTKIDMDNGSLPLAKDALRALVKTKLSGAHRSIIDVIWLETYAWHDENSDHTQKIKKRRTHARIPYQVFMDETWMNKPSISRRINELVEWGVILRDKNTSPYTYSFNVHVDQWDKNIFRDTRVNRIVNSSQAQTPNCQGIADPLKKDKESIKEREEKSSINQNKVPYQKIVDLYHERCPSYPRVIQVSESRKRHIRARWNQHQGKIDVFATAFQKAESSAFMKGDNDRRWTADFDWIMNENNMTKILEGKYDKPRGSPKQAKPKPKPIDETQSPVMILSGECEIFVPPRRGENIKLETG